MLAIDRLKKMLAKKHDKVKFDILPQIIEEYISVRYGCIRFTDSYRLSFSLDNLVKTFVDNSHKIFKDFEEEIVDDDEILKIVNEVKRVLEEDRHNNESIKFSIKKYPDINKKNSRSFT